MRIGCSNCPHALSCEDSFTPVAVHCVNFDDRVSWKPYQDRMKTEYRHLKARYERLHKMLVRYDAGTLHFKPTCPIELLRRQAEVMGQYLYILETRAEIEGVKLEEESV
jgi:hypothetical protein